MRQMVHIKRSFSTNMVYHVLNRGVDKRRIFLHDKDYLRFIHDLFEFNDVAEINNTLFSFNRMHRVEMSALFLKRRERKPRKLLVEILAFCLMPNHYHLLLRPKVESSVTKFMRRLNMGYAKYFNEKYERSGALFQGRYKAVPVTTDAHFLHLPYYIHANPLDLSDPEWRKNEMTNPKRAWGFLENYRWSSHRDYLGLKNFPSVTQREFLQEILGEPKAYEKKFKKWLRDISFETLEDKLLE